MPARLKLGTFALLVSTALLTGCAKPSAEAPAAASGKDGLDVLAIREIPAGNYLCSLLIHGQEQKLNFEIADNRLRCVDATEKGMIGLTGRSELIGNGVFLTQLMGGDWRASQMWILARDGSATIKEIPDRGERQRAVPVKGTTIDAAANK